MSNTARFVTRPVSGYTCVLDLYDVYMYDVSGVRVADEIMTCLPYFFQFVTTYK